VLEIGIATLTEWEIQFLRDFANRGHRELTTRQAEKLLEIRDSIEMVKEIGRSRFSVRILLAKCHEARSDLNEDDEEFILKTREKNLTMIRRRDGGRLLRCAFQLNLIAHESIQNFLPVRPSWLQIV
jgi:hypothetical protein